MTFSIPLDDDRPLSIIETVWHYLSPFSAHQITIWGEDFATVEHAYHWARYKPGPQKDAIKATRSPIECLMLSHSFKKSHPDALDPAFNKDAVMEELFRAKMAQHPHIVAILRASGSRVLLKEISTDAYWGTGPDGSGHNHMGKLWMKLRDELPPK